MVSFSIQSIRQDHILGFREALDSVARERLYLAFLEAPSLEITQQFVCENIEKQNPHFVALVDNKVVGWCDVTELHRPIYAHVGSLGLGVVSAYRGMGIGKALMETTLKAAQSKGLLRIELDVVAHNVRAQKLYEKFGFVREGVYKNRGYVNGQFQDHIFMALLF